MAKLVPFLFGLSSLILVTHGYRFDCGLLPENKSRSDAIQKMHFGISMNATDFTVGGYPVEVKLKSTGHNMGEQILFTHFILQAHDVLDKLHGRFEPIASSHLTRKCGMGDKDTLYSADSMGKVLEIKALWFPDFPPTEEIPLKDIDFNAAVMLVNGSFWTDIRSTFIKAKDVHTDPREDEGPASDTDEETEANGEEPDADKTEEDPNGPEIIDEREQDLEQERDNMDDDHDLAKEEELSIKMKEEFEEKLRQEDEESEGDWLRKELEEKEKEEEAQHQEMVEYERVMAEEEQRRREMIQWEIRDKEEHDRLLAQQTTTKPPKTVDEEKPSKPSDDRNEIRPDVLDGDSGASVSVISLLVALLPAIFLLI